MPKDEDRNSKPERPRVASLLFKNGVYVFFVAVVCWIFLSQRTTVVLADAQRTRDTSLTLSEEFELKDVQRSLGGGPYSNITYGSYIWRRLFHSDDFECTNVKACIQEKEPPTLIAFDKAPLTRTDNNRRDVSSHQASSEAAERNLYVLRNPERTLPRLLTDVALGHFIVALPSGERVSVTRTSVKPEGDDPRSWSGVVDGGDGLVTLAGTGEHDIQAFSLVIRQSMRTIFIYALDSSMPIRYVVDESGYGRPPPTAGLDSSVLEGNPHAAEADPENVPTVTCTEDGDPLPPRRPFKPIRVLALVSNQVSTSDTALGVWLRSNMEDLRTAMVRSEIDAEVTLVRQEPFSLKFESVNAEQEAVGRMLTEVARASTLLPSKAGNKILENDPVYKAIQEGRTSNPAELVVLLTQSRPLPSYELNSSATNDKKSNGYFGFATQVPANRRSYMAVVQASEESLLGRLVLLHEVGHLLGAGHDIATAGETVPPFNHGYVFEWARAGNQSRSVGDLMSKTDMRVMRFSSAAPHVTCNRKQLGNRAANNAEAIRSALPYIAQLFDKRQVPEERIDNLDLPICSAIRTRESLLSRDECTPKSIQRHDEIILFDRGAKDPLPSEMPKILRLLSGGLVARLEVAYHEQEQAVIANKRSNPPHPVIVVGGHADVDGSTEANVGLAYGRARKIYDMLHEDESLPLVICSFGETHPICPNSADDTKALNRRVEVKAVTMPVE